MRSSGPTRESTQDRLTASTSALPAPDQSLGDELRDGRGRVRSLLALIEASLNGNLAEQFWGSRLPRAARPTGVLISDWMASCHLTRFWTGAADPLSPRRPRRCQRHQLPRRPRPSASVRPQAGWSACRQQPDHPDERLRPFAVHHHLTQDCSLPPGPSPRPSTSGQAKCPHTPCPSQVPKDVKSAWRSAESTSLADWPGAGLEAVGRRGVRPARCATESRARLGEVGRSSLPKVPGADAAARRARVPSHHHLQHGGQCSERCDQEPVGAACAASPASRPWLSGSCHVGDRAARIAALTAILLIFIGPRGAVVMPAVTGRVFDSVPSERASGHRQRGLQHVPSARRSGHRRRLRCAPGQLGHLRHRDANQRRHRRILAPRHRPHQPADPLVAAPCSVTHVEHGSTDHKYPRRLLTIHVLHAWCTVGTYPALADRRTALGRLQESW